MIGTILGNRFEILEVVGSGGLAVVYKAKDRLLNRFVAVKMLRDELKNDKEFVDRFRVEAQSAASLNQQNIVSVYDVGEENGNDYFVMEFIDGVTLKEIIETRSLDWRTACQYAAGICNAIEHAHKKNIVHRDIKPHNIMVTKDNVVKVTDFGIARAVSSSTIVRAGNVIGSVHYFSPEQACGGVVDFKSDIYSIGVVLYEMLTGKVPFNADNPVAIAKMHVDNAVIPPSQIRPEIPAGVNDIVLKAMAKQPMMRYQSVTEFSQDLKKVLSAPDSMRVRDEDATQFVPVVDAGSTMAIPSVPDRVDIGQEDFGEEEVRPRKTAKQKGAAKSTVVAWVIAGVVLVASVFVVVMAFNPGLFAGGEIDVPNLIGQKYSEALKQYENADFKLVLKESEFDETYEADTIIKQDPSTGKVKKGGVINVTVSKGKDSVTLNDYTGRDINDVKSELTVLGIENVSIEYEEHQTYPKDTIFKQSPGKGSMLKKGEKLTLYVSKGKEEAARVKVPKLTGLGRTAAKQTLEAVGLEVGEVTSVANEAAEGTVISQAISEGTQVKEGTAISYTVSKGPATPEPTATPKSTPAHTVAPTATPASTPAATTRATQGQAGGEAE